jgi:pimeloyl-ACP methyl ester carboxylesterase
MDTAQGAKRYQDGHFTRDGLRLHYRDYPGSSDLPPLLCLHGLTRNAKDFAELAERYSPQFRVIVPEFRGRGESDYDPIPARYQPLTYAHDVLQLLGELGIERAIFIGTSLGGLVTMVMAAVAPKRIAATILNDIGPELSEAGLDRIRNYVGRLMMFRNWDNAAKALAAYNRQIPASYTHDDWLTAARRVAREEPGKVIFDYDPAIRLAFDKASSAPQANLWPLYRMLGEKPLLVVRGELSDLVSTSAAEKMQQATPDAKFAVVPGVGHAPELNEPEAAAAIDSFVAELRSRFERQEPAQAG